MRSCTSFSRTISLISRLSRATIAGEVPAGANKPTQVPSSKSYPSSFSVGTSGSAATRAGLAIASPFSVPCCTRLIIAGSELLTRSTWPPAAAPTAGPPPWNGTCTASTFASTLKK